MADCVAYVNVTVVPLPADTVIGIFCAVCIPVPVSNIPGAIVPDTRVVAVSRPAELIVLEDILAVALVVAVAVVDAVTAVGIILLPCNTPVALLKSI
jgi:hypothetical protein